MPRSSLLKSAAIPLRIIFVMWLVFIAETVYVEILNFGIEPRTIHGLWGLLMAPMIHGSLSHLISNSIPLLFLGSILFYFHDRMGMAVFLRGYFWTNLLVWLFARPVTTHIGASGLVYAIAFFLIFYGIFKRDFTSILISTLILLTYGGIFYGVLPGDPRVSWESHLAGALVGISTAITFSKKTKSS